MKKISNPVIILLLIVWLLISIATSAFVLAAHPTFVKGAVSVLNIAIVVFAVQKVGAYCYKKELEDMQKKK